MNKLWSLAIGLAAAAAAFVVAAVCLAILELYLSGHGYRTLMDLEAVNDPARGIHLSVADLIALSTALLVGALSTWLAWRQPKAR